MSRNLCKTVSDQICKQLRSGVFKTTLVRFYLENKNTNWGVNIKQIKIR